MTLLLYEVASVALLLLLLLLGRGESRAFHEVGDVAVVGRPLSLMHKLNLLVFLFVAVVCVC